MKVEILLMILYIILFIVNYKNNKLKFFLASAMSLIWVNVASEQYGYTNEMIKFLGMNSFPLFAWPAGILIMDYIFQKIKYSKLKSFHFLQIVFVSLVFIITLEYTGYHILGIQNAATAQYEGLAICDCLHAPPWMKFVYFAMAPAFFLIYNLIITLYQPIRLKLLEIMGIIQTEKVN